MKRAAWAVCSVVVGACAGQKAEVKPDDKKAEPKIEKIALANVSPFDVAACSVRPLEPGPLSTEAIIGVLLTGQPAFQECLVDGTTRGEAKETKVTVKATVSDADVKVEVGGENLQPDGKACIESAVKKLPLKPLAKGAAPVSGAMGLLHLATTSPSVKMGLNAASDVVGNVRLAQMTWCDCYQDFATTPPPTKLKASLKFAPAKATEISLEPATDPAAQKLATCLEAKLKGLPFAPMQSELQVPYAFLLVNSYAASESPDAPPPFQFLQLESIRGQRNADVAIRLGSRGLAAGAYDAVVSKYKAKPTPALIGELKTKCQAVLTADEGWVKSLESLLETDARVLKVVSSLKAQDPQWGVVETESQKRVATVTGDIDAAKKQKDADANACPKKGKD